MKNLSIGFLTTLLLGCSSSQVIENAYGEKVKVSCQPVYGKWCGKGYPAYEITGHKPSPVDQWDSACRHHDLCYERYGKAGEDYCDRLFTDELEDIYGSGVPIPRQIVNAYNVFKEDLSYRFINVPFTDILDANTLKCDGSEGRAALFCDVGVPGLNCQIVAGNQGRGDPCTCTYPATRGPFGFFPGGQLFGRQRTANSF